MKKFQKTIGIIGGIGPCASLKIYARIIKRAQEKYGAVQDWEYPHVILNSVNMEGFDEKGVVDGELVSNRLVAEAIVLEKAGCDLIIMACNTIHCFLNSIERACSIPLLNTIKITCQSVFDAGFKKVGLLCSETTSKEGLYQECCRKYGMDIMPPNDSQQKVINEVIAAVMGGSHSEKELDSLRDIVKNFLKEGVEAVIVGCTELPLVIKQSDIDCKLFDSMDMTVIKAMEA